MKTSPSVFRQPPRLVELRDRGFDISPTYRFVAATLRGIADAFDANA